MTEFYSFQRYIVGHKHICNISFLLLFLFSQFFFQIFLMWFFAAKSRIWLMKALLLVRSCDASTFNYIFIPNIACYQWFYLNYSNCTPFFPRENDGEMNITVRLSRLATRFWGKIFSFEKKIVKMSTFMLKLASENQYSIVYY